MMLVYAITLSMALHFALLYVPFLQGPFSIVPLDWNEWRAVVVPQRSNHVSFSARIF